MATSGIIYIIIAIAGFVAYKQGLLDSFIKPGTTTPPPPGGGGGGGGGSGEGPVNYEFSHTWGSNGTGDGQFRQMEGMAVDSDGDVYVGDWVRHDIQRFTPDGTFVRRFGGTVGQAGSGEGEFDTPFGIRFDPRDGNMWVGDQFNNRFQKINRDTGEYMTQVGPDIAGLTGPAGLNMPEDCDFDPVDHSMYISDSENNRIIKLDADFNYVTQWGTYENTFVEGMSVNPVTRNVYVTNYVYARIDVYSPDGQELFHFGEEGPGVGQLTNLLERHAMDKSGRFYQLSGNLNPKVLIYDSDGNFISEFGSGPGTAEGELDDAEMLAVDDDYNVYIVDQNNYRVSVFRPSDATSAYTRSYYSALYKNKMGNVY